MPSVSEIVRAMPRTLQLRFQSVGGFVRGVLEEEAARAEHPFALTEDDIATIQLFTLCFLLDEFFRAGTRAAGSAARSLERFGLEGFTVGSQKFTKDSPETMRGERLADALRAVLQQSSLWSRYQGARTARELVRTLARELSHGRPLG